MAFIVIGWQYICKSTLNFAGNFVQGNANKPVNEFGAGKTHDSCPSRRGWRYSIDERCQKGANGEVVQRTEYRI
jgi:hypothetical protein